MFVFPPDKAELWMCCEQFPAADICLIIPCMMNSLHMLGTSSRFLGPDRRPCLAAYQTNAFKKVMAEI